MAYVVLARKYRPQRFADLVGQEHVTRTLANAIAHDRVHHAYLFCGARGLGKTTAARLLAKCLVCVKGPTIEPCNECSECVAVTEGRSVDVIEIDGASNNRVDDVRNLREQVRYLPQSARRKIYIIDEVHMLTGSAFNALLKTLEEPPPHVTFIFATTEVHALPATILSRVSRFDFRRLSSARLVGHLQNILTHEGVNVEEAGLYMIARAGDGSVRDSLTLLDKVIAFADDTAKVSAEEVRVVLGVPGQVAIHALARAVLARDPGETLRTFDTVVGAGQDLQQLALAFLQHLRNLVVVKLCGDRAALLDASETEYEQLVEQAAPLEPSSLAQLFDRFARTVDSLPHTRVPRLILEMGLLDLVHADPLIPLGDLVTRLEQLSAGAPPAAPLRGSPREISSPRAAEPPRSAAPQPVRQPPPPAPSSAPQPPPRSAPQAAAPQRQASARAASPPGMSEFARLVAESGVLAGDVPPEPEDPEPAAPAAPTLPPGQPGPTLPPGPRQPAPALATPTAQDTPTPRTPAGPQTTAPGGSPAAALPADDPSCASATCPGGPRLAPQALIDWSALEPIEAWRRLVARIRESDAPQVAAALSALGLVSLASGEIRVACNQRFAREHFHAQLRAEAEELTHLFFGAPFKLNVLEGEPALPERPSIDLLEREAAAARQRRAVEEASAHPSIQALLGTFEAELKMVRPHGAA